MRAVLDTNVLISAALGKGNAPDAIVRAGCQRTFQNVTSDALLSELARVLARPHIAERLG